MSSRSILLQPGTWYAGIRKPWFVPESVIDSALQKEGLSSIAFHKRDESLPSMVHPRNDPRYSDDWDTWISAEYHGAQRQLTIDHYDFVAWMLVIADKPPPAPAKPEPPTPKPEPAHGLPSLFDPETIGRHLVAGYIAAAITHHLIPKVVLTLVLDEALVVAEAKAKALKVAL